MISIDALGKERGPKSSERGRTNVYTLGPLSVKVFYENVYPVGSSHLCTEGNSMPMFQGRELRGNEITGPAWDHKASDQQSWLWIQLWSVPNSCWCHFPPSPFWEEGFMGRREWGTHCSRLVLTYVSSLISQQSLKKGTVIIPIWQVKTTWISQLNATSEVADNPQEGVFFKVNWISWQYGPSKGRQ